ncbi:MAG: biotin/lipoate A/B protein ligase family protein [Gemmatimonadota bacterium]
MLPLHSTWRLVRTEPGDGAYNMAVDEMLADAVRAGAQPSLRLYSWEPPAVSLGRNQPASREYDRQALRAAGIDLVRRPTGGRAVLHDAELTYSVAAPARWFGSARRAYRRINEVLVVAVERLGAFAAVHPAVETASAKLDNAPCFAEPAAGEVVAGGRKLIGSAQLCEGGVLLQHGSIPLRQSGAYARLAPPVARLLDGRSAYLEEVLGAAVSWNDAADAIVEAWNEEVAPLDLRQLQADELELAERLAARYRSDDWTWRR